MRKRVRFVGLAIPISFPLAGCLTIQVPEAAREAIIVEVPTAPVPSIPLVAPTATPRPAPSKPNPSWSEALAASFDIVETFDELQPWQGRCGGNFYGKTSTPKKLDGSASIWTYYSCWGSIASSSPWIDDFGTGTQVSGKSLIIDMGRTNKGPSRLGVYFGDVSPTSGYDDLYLFYRVRFPANEWPTQIDATSKVGEYQAGDPFTYWFSWKFGAFNIGCTGMDANDQCDGAEPYSSMHIVPHIKRYGYGAMTGKIAIVHEPTGLTPYWALGKEIQREKWLGVEFHYKLSVQDSQNVVIMETWLYDEDGTAYQAQAPVAHPYTTRKQQQFLLLGSDHGKRLPCG